MLGQRSKYMRRMLLRDQNTLYLRFNSRTFEIKCQLCNVMNKSKYLWHDIVQVSVHFWDKVVEILR